MDRLKAQIRTVPDFPKPGIQFRDITPILSNAQMFRLAVTVFSERYQRKHIEKIAAIDARGFLFAGALAHILGIGLVPIRKKGKLPFDTMTAAYDLEYGANELQIHTDALRTGERVLLFDDVLATGGTASAAIQLIQGLGGEIVENAFLIEISDLRGKEKLKGLPVFSAIQF